jgi:RNA polymerase sigma-70 factor (ECF subfamily)
MQPNEWNAADAIFRRYLERPRRRRLARVVDAFYRHVWGTALRVCGNGADAADITQDVFLKLLLHPPAPDRVKSPRAFLAWEVVGRASSIRRSEERRKSREQVALRRAEDEPTGVTDVEALRSGVCELPDDLRAAVELRYFAGLRNSDIAEVLGVGERHVEKRLEEARHLLRARLGPAAAPVLLFEAHFAEGAPLAGGSDGEPPERLHHELLAIVASGSALAKLSALGAVTTASSAAGSHPVAAALALACLLFLGSAAAILVSSRIDQGVPTEAASKNSDVLVGVAARQPASNPVPDAHREEVEASSPPYGEIHAVAQDEKGARVAEARVLLKQVITSSDAEELRKNGFLAATACAVQRELVTDARGECTFANLLPGKVIVDIEKSPFLPNWVATSWVKPRKTRKVEFVLCLPLRVLGSVRTPEEVPVERAQVFIGFDEAKHYYADPTESEPGHDHAFDVDGEGRFDTGFGIVNTFRFKRLPLYVLAPGREAKYYYLNCDEFTEREMRLDVVLGPERQLRVFVQDPQGAPVSQAKVHAGELAVHQVTTDDAGAAVIGHLPSGEARISIQVFKEGYISESAATTSLETEELPVILRPLDPGIEGRIVLDEKLPPEARGWPSIDVYELDDKDRSIRQLGNVRISKQGDGFTLHPGKPLRFEVEYQVGWRTISKKPLVYDGVHQLDVELPVRLEPPYLMGRVIRSGTHEPLPGVLVKMHLPWRDHNYPGSLGTLLNDIPLPCLPGNRSRVTTDGNGFFVFLLSSTDRYRHEAPLRRRAILTAGTPEIGYSPDVAFDIDIQPDTVVKDVELEVDGFGAIAGSVLDETGQPLPGALVAAFDGRWYVKHAKADSSGRFHIDGLRPGRYQVEFLGHAPHPREGSGDGDYFRRPEDFLELPVSVAAGQTSEWNLDLRTDTLGAIDGVIAGDIAGAVAAKCEQLRDGKVLQISLFSRESEVRNGVFHLESLFPGRYRVWLESANWGRLAEMDVDVKRGSRAAVSIAPSTGSLEIPIVGPADAPWDEAKVYHVTREEPYSGRKASPVQTDIAAPRVVITRGRIQLDGLVPGRIEATILVPGFQALKSEPVMVEPGRTAVAPPTTLLLGSSVRVSLDLPDGLRLNDEPQFSVNDSVTGTEVLLTSQRKAGDLAWDLGALPEGNFTIGVFSGAEFDVASVDVSVAPRTNLAVRVGLTRRGE